MRLMSHFAPLNRSELEGEFMFASLFLLFLFFLFSFPSSLLLFSLIEGSILRVYLNLSSVFSSLLYFLFSFGV